MSDEPICDYPWHETTIDELRERVAKLEAACRDARSTIPDGKPGSQNFKVRAALDAVLGR